ncbi:MAG: V-type ATP synthase subunit C [Inconstantimicrobium porci]|uniref:V-type ATP synthase subunit C n=1 Tax=Inconstantimicrobium porci TaxID=2652291 RepID=A0A7X2SZU5_9CLOT|nr:V-type ATP synthase subunit C [Inconstantimicrobium porci]MDD6770228.1 V-type ATP synthase subunit C [Inconstantimicrobium porci]MDY5912496.1 V-type ATP synthase subunit C [Inconstantimicrobium porci]MSR89867.1 V-type ATP synthase subunit C [Inconstantimicrobium porci]
MDKEQFIPVIPRVKVYETKLLDKAKFERMIESDTAQEALKVLQETEYANVMGDVKRAEDYEEILSSELTRVYDNLYRICPDTTLIEIMSLRYEYHNIKVLVKGKVAKKDFSNMLINLGSTDTEKLKFAIDNEAYRELDSFKKKSVEESIEDFNANNDPQNIDLIIDKYMFEEMVYLAKKINENFVLKYVKSQIDLANIKTLLRVKKQDKSREFLQSVLIKGGEVSTDMLVLMLNDSAENIASKLSYTRYGAILKEGIESYAKTGSVSLFEKLSDNFIMSLLKGAKIMTSGVEPIIAYIYAKENEIKLIRIIMVGKLNNISAEVIRERLRDSYV